MPEPDIDWGEPHRGRLQEVGWGFFMELSFPLDICLPFCERVALSTEASMVLAIALWVVARNLAYVRVLPRIE